MRKLASLAVPLLAFALAFACAPVALAESPADVLQAQGISLQDLTTQDEGDDNETTAVEHDLEITWNDKPSAERISRTYTGKEIEPAFTVTFDGVKLETGQEITDDGIPEGAKYDYLYMYSNNVNVGDASAQEFDQPQVWVIVIAEDAEYGMEIGEKYFDITQAPISSVSSVKAQTYTGEQIKPKVTVKSGNITLAPGDYTTTYKNNINKGTASVTVTAKANGNFKGGKTVKFTINKANIKKKGSFSEIKTQTYNGKAITPKVTVRYNGKKLKAGTDYKIAYSNNKNVGTAKATITGKGNFTGTKIIKFKINKASIKNATVSNIGNKTYTGNALKPNVTVKYKGKKLKKNTDYTLTYSKNVNAGIAKIKITGKGNMKGTRAVDFVINPRDISKASASIGSATWTGWAVTPSYLTLRYNGKTLKNGKDFTVYYRNNIEVGSGQAYIAGMGNFTGYKEPSFRISPRSIEGNQAGLNSAGVNARLTSSIYAVTDNPSPFVSYNNIYLANGKDYTYYKTVDGDKGTIVVTGKGHYTGTRYLPYSIYKQQTRTTS